jgi:hypothetical protein
MAHSAVNIFLQEHFMKRKVLLLLVLATLIAGGAFAQKVGDIVDVMGQKYDVKEAKDGRLVLQLAATLDGTWSAGGGSVVITINGNSGVYKKFTVDDDTWQDALKKGYFKMGDQYYRNLSKTGALTWTGQRRTVQHHTNTPSVAISTGWANCTLTLSADGKTLSEKNGITWTRQ